MTKWSTNCQALSHSIQRLRFKEYCPKSSFAYKFLKMNEYSSKERLNKITLKHERILRDLLIYNLDRNRAGQIVITYINFSVVKLFFPVHLFFPVYIHSATFKNIWLQLRWSIISNLFET